MGLSMTVSRNPRRRRLRGSGNAGCNSWNASVILRDDQIDFTNIVTTKKMCAKPQMTAEDAFLTSLRSAKRWHVDGDKLIIEGDAARLMLKPGVAELKPDKKPAKRSRPQGNWKPRVAASAAEAASAFPPRQPMACSPSPASEFVADPAGVIYWPEQGLLAVADLHLEKGSSFAARGVLLPPYDTAATLARLGALIARYAPRVVVALGDSFHDGRGPARLADTDRATLRSLQRGRDWIWIAGNHDPEPAEGIGGRFLATLALGALTFRHRAGRRTPAARSPAICIRSRGWRGAAAPSAGAALPATASAW